MKFFWNPHFKYFKETRQESEKKKNLLRQKNLKKNILFYCGFYKKLQQVEHCSSQSSA